MAGLEVKFARSSNLDAAQAVKELAQATRLTHDEAGGAIFFCSPKYDLAALGRALRDNFDCPLIGCTSAGEILGGEGYVDDSIVIAVFAADKLKMRPLLIENLDAFVRGERPAVLEPLRYCKREQSFTLLLIDGLSMLEEQVIATINRALSGMPLIGASAGDGLNFKHTFVYYNGAFREGIAVLALFETALKFKPFHIQHFEPTGKRLVITEANSATRTVTEINGMPAVEEYADAVGVSIARLSPQIFAAHPVMLKIGGEYYVRSIQKVNDDGSLTFFCAIDAGLVLTVARPTNLIENLQTELAKIRDDIPEPALIFGSDCILRRLEMIERGELDRIKPVLGGYPFIGFSTYGEQFCGIHVNHTLTAMVIGE
jgi:hypothetical protein